MGDDKEDCSHALVDEKKRRASQTPVPHGASSPTAEPQTPLIAPLDDAARATFATGRPLEDPPELQTCKHCKKSLLRQMMPAHLVSCLKAKKEKAQAKKEAKERRERERRGLLTAKEGADEGDDGSGDDGDEAKKRKLEGGKKRKAEGELVGDKSVKFKKRKEESKAKLIKAKGAFLKVFIQYDFQLTL